MGYPVGPWYARVVQHRQRPPAAGQAAPDRRRDGHERPARVDDAAGRCPDQGRQGLRAAGRSQRQPRHGRRLRPAADARLLRPPPAGRRPKPPVRAGSPAHDVAALASTRAPDEHRASAEPRSRERRRSTWGSSTNDGSELRGAIERYEADRGSLLRSLPPPARRARDERLREFTDAVARPARQRSTSTGSSQDGKVDYLLFKNHLAHELRQLDIRGTRARRVASRWSRSPGRSSSSTRRGAS